MSVRIKCLSFLALGLAACGGAGPANGGEANPLRAGNDERARPLAPSMLEISHVEFDDEKKDRDNSRTYIRTDQILGEVFGNFVFASDDQLVASLTHGAKYAVPRFFVSSSLKKTATINDLLERFHVLSGERKVAGRLSISEISDPGGFIFLFPNVDDYIQSVSRLNAEPVNGLGKFISLGSSCSYARLSLDHGERQAAFLLIHASGGSIQFEREEDRTCLIRFFSENWGVAPESSKSLIYGRLPAPHGKCEIARIMQPETVGDTLPPERSGCPIAPLRRPESVVAYARRQGVGVGKAQAQALEMSARSFCDNLKNPDDVVEESCRAAFKGTR